MTDKSATCRWKDVLEKAPFVMYFPLLMTSPPLALPVLPVFALPPSPAKSPPCPAIALPDQEIPPSPAWSMKQGQNQYWVGLSLREGGRTGAEGVGDVLALVEDAAAVHVAGVSGLGITAVTRLEERGVATLAVSCDGSPGLGDTTISSLVCKRETMLGWL